MQVFFYNLSTDTRSTLYKKLINILKEKYTYKQQNFTDNKLQDYFYNENSFIELTYAFNTIFVPYESLDSYKEKNKEREQKEKRDKSKF